MAVFNVLIALRVMTLHPRTTRLVLRGQFITRSVMSTLVFYARVTLRAGEFFAQRRESTPLVVVGSHVAPLPSSVNPARVAHS